MRDDYTNWDVSTYFTRRNIDNTLPLMYPSEPYPSNLATKKPC